MIIVETSVKFEYEVAQSIVHRIGSVALGDLIFIQVPQDEHLSRNQREAIRCGDNGVFTAKWNTQYKAAAVLAKMLGEHFPHDGKYLFDFDASIATICQSNATNSDIEKLFELAYFKKLIINPLGEWTGGTNTDAGCTNRKLGSDQPFCNPNGLHGKDLSKADVSVSIYINALHQKRYLYQILWFHSCR